MPLEIVVTNAGRASLINADHTGTAPVTITQVGLSSAAVVPLRTDTELAGEFKRVGAVSGEVVADDTIHLSVMDFSGDSYTLRSVGLYLADGTLFAIYGQPGAILEKTANSDAALSLDVIFADISAALLTFGDATFSNPPASETRQGVAEIATQVESNAGDDDMRFVTPKKNRASFLSWFASALPLDLWRASNDGAGSGMDADLLDGQQGSWYSNIIARLGFTPVQQGTGVAQLANTIKMGWSGSRVRVTVDLLDQGNMVFDSNVADVWRSSNDGSGSGLDADLLDGLQAASFARTDIGSGANFAGGVTAPYLRSTGAAAVDGALTVVGSTFLKDATISRGNGTGALYFGNALNFLWFDGANYSFTGGAGLYINGAILWSSANDGPGSGLDADALDGYGGESYARMTGLNGSASGGFRIYADGFKECWGSNSYAGDETKTINYPFTFAAWSKAFVEGGVNSTGQQENGPYVISATTTGFTGMNAANASVPVNWFAFGY